MTLWRCRKNALMGLPTAVRDNPVDVEEYVYPMGEEDILALVESRGNKRASKKRC